MEEHERAVVSRDVSSLKVPLVGRVAEVGDPARAML